MPAARDCGPRMLCRHAAVNVGSHSSDSNSDVYVPVRKRTRCGRRGEEMIGVRRYAIESPSTFHWLGSVTLGSCWTHANGDRALHPSI